MRALYRQVADEMRLILPGQIDLWVAGCDAADERAEQYRTLLTDYEKDGEYRFHFERDRRRYLTTRVLIRTVLSRYSATPPTAWRFHANRYGRPEIANDGDAERSLSFNVSHTSDVILMAVTRDNVVGVDIESVNRAPEALDIAERFFSSDEVEALRALPAPLQYDRFFELWTLKEAYIKARGMGLSIPLDSFSFDLREDATIGFSVRARAGDTTAGWRFWQLRPFPGHVAAVCITKRCGPRQQLWLRKIVPLDSDTVHPWTLLRQSAD
jgi:4'-phosphopantetheinyl transferase